MIYRTARRRNTRTVIDTLESRTLFASVIGLTADDELVTFDSATPGTASAPVAVTGLGGGEELLGIDYRPATGQLFGLGSTGQVYTINATTGAATAVGTPLTVAGTNFGVDFNPQVDRLRIVSDADENLRVVPGTGALAATDTTLAYAAGDANEGDNPNVVAAAYSNNTASAGSTSLYVIDSTTNTLATQGSGPGATTPVSPNTGQLFTIGALGVDVGDVGGFDVAESDGVAYAAFVPAGGTGSSLYTVNLTTGAATAVGAVGTNLTLKDVTAVPVQRSLFVLATSGTAFAQIDLADLATNPTPVNITGLGTETIDALDFRPATGQLFGSTDDGDLFTIDLATGAATAVSATENDLEGDLADIDFNPTVDRVRAITDEDANARINPDTGALVDSDTATAGTQVDTDLAYASTDAGTGANPDVVAAAYTNSVQGATTTTLYGIDAGRDVLVSIGSVEGAATTVSPNTGQLFTIGALGVDVVSGGFDIANDGPAYALINAAGGVGTQLYAINTTAGTATLIGTVGDGTQTFSDVAVGATVFTVSPATQNVAEDVAGGNATVTVTRGGIADGEATVAYELIAPPQGTAAATAGTDFGTAGQTTFSGIVTFADGETTKTITIPILDDATVNEGNETLIIGLSSPSVGGLGATSEATVVITEDDEAATVVVANDPVRTGKNISVMTVNGTSADEEIVVTQSGSTLVVTVNGTAVGTPTSTKGLYRIVVNAGAGDDLVRINSKIKYAAEIHGQDGDDILIGSKGRDLLVGGDGVDALYGRGGEDILIGGISDYTGNPTATANILNFWLGKGNFASRASAITTGTGINNFVFSSATIDDDTDRDYLAGEGTADLILTHVGDAVADESPKGLVQALTNPT